MVCRVCLYFIFFFQAEDGIRDLYETGVQTCALPIWRDLLLRRLAALGVFDAGLHALGLRLGVLLSLLRLGERLHRAALDQLGPELGEQIVVGIDVGDRKSVV